MKCEPLHETSHLLRLCIMCIRTTNADSNHIVNGAMVSSKDRSCSFAINQSEKRSVTEN